MAKNGKSFFYIYFSFSSLCDDITNKLQIFLEEFLSEPYEIRVGQFIFHNGHVYWFKRNNKFWHRSFTQKAELVYYLSVANFGAEVLSGEVESFSISFFLFIFHFMNRSFISVICGLSTVHWRLVISLQELKKKNKMRKFLFQNLIGKKKEKKCCRSKPFRYHHVKLPTHSFD